VTPEPRTTLDARFSSPGATPTPWSAAVELLVEAELHWLTTLRTDGTPHVTPLLAVWRDDALHFCTGVTEQKHRNLARDPRCTVLTGCNGIGEGLDLVIEGAARLVTDEGELRRLADAWVEDHGPDWRFEVRDGSFWSEEGGPADVFRLPPRRAFGFGKGASFSQTRWDFAPT
jgi:hypothetical protein